MMLLLRTAAAPLFLLCATGAVQAQSTSAPAAVDGQTVSAPSPGLGDATEYGGVVTSQVLTSLGHYFHGKFTEGWNTYADAQTYVLLVREFYSPRFGTEIRVIYNDRVVYRSVMPRNPLMVAELGRNAAETVHSNVVELGLQNMMFNDPDVAKSGY